MLVRAALRIGIHQSVPMLPVVRDRAGIANLLKPSHQPNPDLLHWVETHLLNPYAITAAATVLLVFVPFILLFLQRRGRTASFEPSVTDRTVMLQRVRHMWIGGVLEPSVAGTEHLNLGLHRRPDVINAPSPPASRTYRSATIPPGKTILQIFDEISGGLLILGGPGPARRLCSCNSQRDCLIAPRQRALIRFQSSLTCPRGPVGSSHSLLGSRKRSQDVTIGFPQRFSDDGSPETNLCCCLTGLTKSMQPAWRMRGGNQRFPP